MEQHWILMQVSQPSGLSLLDRMDPALSTRTHIASRRVDAMQSPD